MKKRTGKRKRRKRTGKRKRRKNSDGLIFIYYFFLIFMKHFVGTSGWAYSAWNPTGTFEWYAKNSGLNAVELNASFYRFPFPSMIKGWSEKGDKIRWAIKVNRLVTHIHQFGPKSRPVWKKFLKLFEPMDDLVDFYLFQLPPRLTTGMKARLSEFIRMSGLGERFALEARNTGWFGPDALRWAESAGVTFVSVDAPGLPRKIYNTSGSVYLRMHGRTAWYSHNYSKKELEEVAIGITAAKPKAAYVFFNNDTDMLGNARTMLGILKRKS